MQKIKTILDAGSVDDTISINDYINYFILIIKNQLFLKMASSTEPASKIVLIFRTSLHES